MILSVVIVDNKRDLMYMLTFVNNYQAKNQLQKTLR